MFAIFGRTGHVQGLTTSLLLREDSSLVYLFPSPPSIAVLAGGPSHPPPMPLSIRCLSYPSGATWALPKLPLHRQLSSSALLSRRALYLENIPLRPLIRPRNPAPLAILPSQAASTLGCAEDQPLPLAPRFLLLFIASGPAGPLDDPPACYHPFASPTAATALTRRYGPGSCRLAGPGDTHPVRPRPRRAGGDSSFTASAAD